MSTIKPKELRSMSAGELDSKLTELRKNIMNDNSQVATGTTPKSPGQLRENKKLIARILTVLKEKESAEPVKAEKAEDKEQKPKKSEEE